LVEVEKDFNFPRGFRYHTSNRICNCELGH
jgi:hypothetical protein